MVEVEVIPLPMLKSRLTPPLDKYLGVGLMTNGMGMVMLGILVDGNIDTTNVPQMETCVETNIDDVGPMALKDGKVEITGMPSYMLVDGIDDLAILDKTLGPDIV